MGALINSNSGIIADELVKCGKIRISKKNENQSEKEKKIIIKKKVPIFCMLIIII